MKYFIFASILFSQVFIFACDDVIKSFPRDCAIQDRFVALKAAYAARNTDIDDISEYRVIRFVDRSNWERAKIFKVRPENIYQPAPATWNVWESGIRAVMQLAGTKNSLSQGYIIDERAISLINKNLLMNEELALNVKDSLSDQSLKPGEFRKATSIGVGFRTDGATDYNSAIVHSEESMLRFQQKWEAKMGVTFSQLLKEAGAAVSEGANMKSNMSYDYDRSFVFYAPSPLVRTKLDWIEHFIRFNLEKYKAGSPVLSPLELATVVQKWFVSLHPFSDGNGRTSRAIQDIILTNFEMPVVPGGDLQDDATAVYENYIERTYSKLEAMLSALELCQTRNATLFHCQTIEQINAMEAGNQGENFQKATRKKD